MMTEQKTIVKERPILFSTPMVQAILEGRKTMTRRIVKNHSELIEEVIAVPRYMNLEEYWGQFRITWESGDDAFIECPYGKPGDILWVRETWAKDIYGKTFSLKAHGHRLPGGSKWKPSIHMAKDLAQLWLQITDIRAERIEEISEADCKAEGILRGKSVSGMQSNLYFKNYLTSPAEFITDPKESFKSLWVSINGFDSWEDNPWVWVVSFKVLSTTGKPDYLK